MPVTDVKPHMEPVAPDLPRVVDILLDKQRHLCYDLNALALLEEHYGTLKGAFEALKTRSVKVLRDFLHIGLLREDPGLTLEGAGALFSLSNARELYRTLDRAISGGMPAPDPNAGGPPEETKAPEGSTGPGSTTPGR